MGASAARGREFMCREAAAAAAAAESCDLGLQCGDEGSDVPSEGHCASATAVAVCGSGYIGGEVSSGAVEFTASAAMGEHGGDGNDAAEGTAVAASSHTSDGDGGGGDAVSGLDCRRDGSAAGGDSTAADCTRIIARADPVAPFRTHFERWVVAVGTVLELPTLLGAGMPLVRDTGGVAVHPRIVQAIQELQAQAMGVAAGAGAAAAATRSGRIVRRSGSLRDAGSGSHEAATTPQRRVKPSWQYVEVSDSE